MSFALRNFVAYNFLKNLEMVRNQNMADTLNLQCECTGFVSRYLCWLISKLKGQYTAKHGGSSVLFYSQCFSYDWVDPVVFSLHQI